LEGGGKRTLRAQRCIIIDFTSSVSSFFNSNIRDQRSEIRDQRSEIRDQRMKLTVIDRDDGKFCLMGPDASVKEVGFG